MPAKPFPFLALDQLRRLPPKVTLGARLVNNNLLNEESAHEYNFLGRDC